MSRSKEKYAKFKKKASGEDAKNYTSPHADELDENGSFKHPTGMNSFKGQPVPAHFTFTVNEYDTLQEGEVIGHTRLGQTLYWLLYAVIAKGWSILK